MSAVNPVTRARVGLMNWVNDRAPGALGWWNRHAAQYYAPKNFNLWYYFGSLALVALVNQIVTGIWLTMHYKPSAAEAFLDAWHVRARAGDAAALHFILRPSFPDLAAGAETVAAARRLKEVGPAGLAFYNYGHIRLASLAHIRGALAVLDEPGAPA